MATPTFPESLPAPLISGYGYKDDSGNVSRSEKTFGYQTQKQIGNTPSTDLPVQFIFTNSQMKTFEDFYKDDLINGHKWFTMLIQFGSGYNLHYCRINGKYSSALLSNSVWSVSMNIETDIKNLISEDAYNSLVNNSY